MKKTFSIALLLFSVVVMMAVPAKRGQWRTITLEDGTKVEAVLCGDEHIHYWKSKKGEHFTKTANGFQKADMQKLTAVAKARRSNAAAKRGRRLAKRKVGTVGSYTGEKKGLIILAQFSDVKFQKSNNVALYNRIANEKDFNYGDFVGSVRDYFFAQSEGKFDLTFDVVGPVTLNHSQKYYGDNEAVEFVYEGETYYTERCGGFASDAINAVASQNLVDFSDYDWDGDGEVDQVFVLYAGLGEANGGSENTIWPHEWTLSEAGDYEEGVSPLTYNGVTIDTYACSSELQPKSLNSSQTKIEGIGTICHEFSHCLGYPDFYDTEYINVGMGYWDLMDSGSYNDDGYCPAGYTSYERWVAGWITPKELTDDVQVDNMQSLTDGQAEAYIIYNDKRQHEYFLLENRQLTGWDAYIPGAGLLILHVDYDANVWYDNSVNTTTGYYKNGKGHQCMTYVAADNNYAYQEDSEGYRYYDFDDMSTDTYPTSSNNSFNKKSKPAATMWYATSNGTKYLSKGLTNITQNADGTVAFTFGETGSATGGGDEPVYTDAPEAKGDVLFYESFDSCEGVGGNDDTWSGTVGTKSITATVTDMSGWEFQKAFQNDMCAKFGSTKSKGSAISPTITIEDESLLTFRAAPWNEEESVLQLDLVSDGVTFSDGTTSWTSDILTQEEWNNLWLVLKGSGELKIKFKVSKNRFFLDEVKVQAIKESVPTAIETLTIGTAPKGIYSLDGRYMGNDWSRLPKGVYVMNGKKIVK